MGLRTGRAAILLLIRRTNWEEPAVDRAMPPGELLPTFARLPRIARAAKVYGGRLLRGHGETFLPRRHVRASVAPCLHHAEQGSVLERMSSCDKSPHARAHARRQTIRPRGVMCYYS